jgi:AsmA-like C-terminal region
VAGKASARLLPFPSLTFENVRVGDDIENPVMTIAGFSMDAELAPFLRGEVLIFNMRITKPRALVTIGEDGAVDWTLRPAAPRSVETVTLESVNIVDGIVEVDDRSASRRMRFDELNAKISAKALTGPWKFDGSLKTDGEKLAVSGSTGTLDENKKLSLRLSLSPVSRSVVTEADGRVSLDKGALLFAGDFTLRPALLTDPGAVALRDGEGVVKVAPEKAPAFRIKGKFEARHDVLSLPSYRLETGSKDKPYFAEGSGKISFGASPRFDFLADGAQVTFDTDDAKGGAAASFSERLGSVEAFLKNVPVPTVPGEIRLALPAVVAGDTTIRDVALTASPAGGAWDIKSFSAALPGRTTLEVSGKLGLGANFGFTGKVLLASNQPTGLAVWLTGSADSAVRQLAAFGLAANVDLTHGRQSFDEAELTLGNTTLKGQFVRRSDGAIPSLAASFSGGAISLDDLSALTLAIAGGKDAGALTGHDLDVSLKAGPVTAYGMEAEALDASVRLHEGKLDIDRFLVTGLGGASISATSDLSGFPNEPAGTVDMSILSPDAAELFGLLGGKFPQMPFFAALADRAAAYPGLLTDAKIDIVTSFAGAEAGQRQQTLSLSASAGSGIYSGTATVTGNVTDLSSLAGKVSLQGNHEDPLALMALAGVPVLPVGAPGPVTFDLSADGSAMQGFELKAAAKSEGLDAEMNGKFAPGPEGLTGTGEVLLKSADAEPYLMAAGISFPDMGQGLAAEVRSSFVKSANALRFSNLNGKAADIDVSGDLSFDTWQSAPRATGKLALSYLDLGWLGEMALGQGALASSLEGWPKTSFAADGVAPLQASIDIAAKKAGLRGFGEAGEVTALLVFEKSALGLRSFSGRYLGGLLTGSGDIKNDKGTGLFTGDFRLAGARIEEITPQGSVRGGIDISGSVSATGKSAAALMASITGAGVAKGLNVEISGINPGGLSGILAATENAGQAPEAAAVEKAMAESMRDGALVIGETSLSWTAASGAARFSPVLAQVPGGVFSAALEADLGRQTASIEGKMAFAADAEAGAGALPEVPFSITLKGGAFALLFDAQPLQQFLAQRALEREQARVEALQEELLEGQRLRREARLYTFLQKQRAQAALSRQVAADEARERMLLKALEAARAAEEAKKRAQEDAAAQRAGEAALAQKPNLPEIKVDPQLFNGQDGADGLAPDLQLSPAPIQ